MNSLVFANSDLEQISRLGITHEQVQRQIAIFERGRTHLKLSRPCRVGEGIITIPDDETEALCLRHQEAANQGRLLKFVPASGAASRMFKSLISFNSQDAPISRDYIAGKAEQGDGDAKDCLLFLDNIRSFAFLEDLEQVIGQHGFDLEMLIEEDSIKELLDFLLTERGLNCASLPKGLLKFHRYEDGGRTAFEEHLVEAAAYAQDAGNRCRIHFTVSAEHQDGFEHLFDEVRKRYESRFAVTYEVSFSVQKESTNTIAVDTANRPFRNQDGAILFRPGGHGALIENLNDIHGDIIYIKNIDNIVPDRLKGETFKWKRILGGLLVRIQEKVFSYLRSLAKGESDKQLVEEALSFVKTDLSIMPPHRGLPQSIEAKKAYLVEKLNRPIRVCGVVRNVGEPGGGPFWVEGKDGSVTLQIVESAQIDNASEEQQSIWKSATHFNPVDIVCGVRDYKGTPFDLKRYVDQEAVFISQKSKDGRNLKALELPGLWNGAMADWITVFAEVPTITFNPVKKINDLLRKEHQPEI